MKTDPIGLYIHLPFCLKKCEYCDFCSYDGFSQKEVSMYIAALIKEMQTYKSEQKIKVDTVFFGGGTPSSIPAEYVKEILSEAKEVFDISADAEITLEINPGALSDGALSVYTLSGVNRISIGMQSIHDNELKKLCRIHTFEDFKSTYNAVRSAGINNVNVDIMYGIPDQTASSFLETLRATNELGPEHLSVYSLILEPETPLSDKAHALSIPDDNAVADMYDACVALLGEAGYSHYEISNYAKPGFECRHNLKYWRNREYVGLGIASHSYFCGSRYANAGDRKSVRSLYDYIALPTEFKSESHPVDALDEQSDYVMLALRLSEGILYSDFKERFGYDFKNGKEAIINTLVRHGLAKDDGSALRLTDKGMFVSNSIIAELI